MMAYTSHNMICDGMGDIGLMKEKAGTPCGRDT